MPDDTYPAPAFAPYLFLVTAVIDWREDASLPARTASWPLWTLAMVLVAVVVMIITLVVAASTSGVSMSLCRLHEAREGIPNLEKMDVPLVGQQPLPGWTPGRNVHLRYARSSDLARGSVIDETMCGQPAGQLLVTIGR